MTGETHSSPSWTESETKDSESIFGRFLDKESDLNVKEFVLIISHVLSESMSYDATIDETLGAIFS
jgi:hypothetical protein